MTHWHKIAALIMRKHRIRELVITAADLSLLEDEEVAIAAQELADGLHIKLMPMKQAEQLAKREGGLPV